MTDRFYGDFDHVPPTIVPEGAVRIVVQPIDLMTYWRRCGLLADFGAAFSSYAAAGRSPDEELVSTVFNELIENAAKFSRRRDAAVVIDVKHYHRVIKIEVQNRCDAARLDGFERFLGEIGARGEVESLYFDKLGKKRDGDAESGIGLLMLLKDYPVKLGVKIVRHAAGDQGGDVTVQAFCFLPPSGTPHTPEVTP